MRYRMEVLEDDELVIRNVETDVKLGTVVPHFADLHNADRWTISGCTILNRGGDEIAMLRASDVSDPLEKGAIAIATYEAHDGYRGLSGCAMHPDPYRIEWRLGTIVADAVSAISRALIERSNGALKPETKDACAELISQLHNIWFASRFGSFNTETQATEPYFANFASLPRMSFAAAAQHYGMWRLRMWFPDVSEATLKAVLSWPLDLLENTLIRIAPPVRHGSQDLCATVAR